MGLFDSLMAGAQVDPQLGAAYGAMPDPRRQAMLRQLGIQAGDPGAQVTGNWMDSLGQQPGGPQRPMSPVPNPSPAASAAQPTGPAPRNPPAPSGQGAPPMPTVAGNAGPMLPGIGTPPPMGQAPSGAPVPASSPLATAGPQGGVPNVGGNAGPMTTPLSGFGGLTPPGDIPAGLRQMVTNPETGRPFTPQQYVNHTVGVLPFSSYDAAMMGPMFQDMYNQHQAQGERALSGLGQLQQALTSAENAGTARATGIGDLGLRSLQQLGGNGVPGQMALQAQEQQNRNSTVQDALNHEAQRQRWLSTVVQQHIQATGTPPTTDEMQQYEGTSRQVFPAAGQPAAAAPGGPPSPGTPPAPGAAPATPPAPGNRGMLDRIWSQVLRQHGTLPSAVGGAPHGPSSLRIDPADPARSNQAITSFVSRALETPGVSIGELHNYLGERFDPGSVTRWMQQQRGGTAGVDAHTEQALGGYLDRLRAAGVNVGDRQYSLGIPGTIPLNPLRWFGL
jgi:hypothetical protein